MWPIGSILYKNRMFYIYGEGIKFTGFTTSQETEEMWKIAIEVIPTCLISPLIVPL